MLGGPVGHDSFCVSGMLGTIPVLLFWRFGTGTQSWSLQCLQGAGVAYTLGSCHIPSRGWASSSVWFRVLALDSAFGARR